MPAAETCHNFPLCLKPPGSAQQSHAVPHLPALVTVLPKGFFHRCEGLGYGCSPEVSVVQEPPCTLEYPLQIVQHLSELPASVTEEAHREILSTCVNAKWER